MSEPISRRDFALALTAPALLHALRLPRRSPLAAPEINPPDARFLASLRGIMDTAGVPAIGISVVRNGRAVWSHHQGVKDVRSGESVDATTLWPAASLSKPVFAYAALRLVDQGVLDLDRPLKAYVPDHAPDDARGNKITARHVLSHSSGLRNWRNRADQPLVPDFEPGARFQYSGEGFYYLQHAVEHIAGMGFEQFMETKLFAPLGMSSSTYAWRVDVPGRLVAGHDQGQARVSPSLDMGQRLAAAADRKGKPVAALTHEEIVAAVEAMNPAPPALPNYLIPNAAASLVTTPSDYAAFLAALLDNSTAAVALKPATHALMSKPQTRINDALSWALGIGLERQTPGAAAGEYLWHWGDNGAWKNFVLAHPASRSAIVIFTNGSRGLNVARRVVTAATGEDHAAFLWL